MSSDGCDSGVPSAVRIRDGWYETTVRVRYAEVDQMGIAYNGNYLAWFEVGRTELLRSRGLTYRSVEESGYRLPLSEAGVRYVKPIRYDDVVSIWSRIAGKPGVRFRIEYVLECNGEEVATGFTEHVWTDAVLTPRRPPNYFLDAFTSDS